MSGCLKTPALIFFLNFVYLVSFVLCKLYDRFAHLCKKNASGTDRISLNRKIILNNKDNWNTLSLPIHEHKMSSQYRIFKVLVIFYANLCTQIKCIYISLLQYNSSVCLYIYLSQQALYFHMLLCCFLVSFFFFFFPT